MRKIIINQIDVIGYRMDSTVEYVGADLYEFKGSEWVYMFCFEEKMSSYNIRFPVHITWNSEVVRENLTPTKSELAASMPYFDAAKNSILRFDNNSGSCSMSARFDRNKSGFYFVTSCDNWADDDTEDGTRFYKEYSVMPFGLLNMKVLDIQRGWQ